MKLLSLQARAQNQMAGAVQVSVGFGIVRVPPLAGTPTVEEKPVTRGLGASAAVEIVLPDWLVVVRMQGDASKAPAGANAGYAPL